jgi:CheY-like chemotaxis protein/archaellum biogenesis ATPase FlaH
MPLRASRRFARRRGVRVKSVALLERALGPGDPGGAVALIGPIGSGRTVLSLQVAASAAQRGRRVVLLTADSPGVLLQQASSLRIDIEGPMRSGALALLQLAVDAGRLLRTHGVEPLLEALVAEMPGADLLIIDPITSLFSGHLDEEPLRAALAQLFDRPGGRGPQVFATAPTERLEAQPALLRALSDACAALLMLQRDADGGRALAVRKSRFAAASERPLPFAIGPGGARALDVEPAAPRPVAAPDAAAAAVRVAVAAPHAPDTARVLVVDANEADRKQLVGYLCDTYDVREAPDGFAALSAALSAAPRLIVMDPVVPDVPGLGLVAALQKTPMQTPLLVVSHRMGRAADRIRALVLGAADVLPKPVTRLELRRKVDTLIQLPQRPRDGAELEEADLAELAASHTRTVSEADFRARMQRAWQFGEHFGLPSTLGCLAMDSPEGLEALVSACQATLRAEDALLVLDETTALLLLVAAGPDDGLRVLDRIEGVVRNKSERDTLPLHRSCVAVTPKLLEDRWWNSLRRPRAR